MSTLPMIKPPSAASLVAQAAARATEAPQHIVRVRLLEGRSRGASFIREVIAGEPDLTQITSPVTAATSMTVPRRQDADVVVIDYELCGPDSLVITFDLKSREQSPRVLIYSGTADPEITIAAMVAGADGIVHRGELAVDDAIRWVAGGSRWIPDVALPELSRIAARIDRRDVSILGMLLNGTRPQELAAALGVTVGELAARRWAMLEQLAAGRADEHVADPGLARLDRQTSLGHPNRDEPTADPRPLIRAVSTPV